MAQHRRAAGDNVGVRWTEFARNQAEGVRDKVFDVGFIGSQNANLLNSNYNPACLHNPDGNWTCWFGGGYFTNMIADDDATIKLVDDNPNYPARSTKPLRVRQISYGGAASPMRLAALAEGRRLDLLGWRRRAGQPEPLQGVLPHTHSHAAQ